MYHDLVCPWRRGLLAAVGAAALLLACDVVRPPAAPADPTPAADAAQTTAVPLGWGTRLRLHTAGVSIAPASDADAAQEFEPPNAALREYMQRPGGGSVPSGAPAGWPAFEMLRVWVTGLRHTLASLPALLRVDAAATLATFAVAVLRLALVLVPAMLLIAAVRWWHRVWLIPLVVLAGVVVTPIGLSHGATWTEWVVLVVVSVGGALLTRVPVLRWTALLPFVVVAHVVPSHTFTSYYVDDPAFRAHLFAECARLDGERPRNLTPDLVMPFHGINPISDDLLLLTGEGRWDGSIVESWWLRRRNGRFEFESPVRGLGHNLWRGCRLNGTIWMGMNGRLKGVRRLPEGSTPIEEVYDAPLPAADFDFGEAACEPDRQRIYAGEASKEGLWETDQDGRNPRRHHVGGIVLLSERRFDGRIIISNSGAILVFDPDEQRVIERTPSGLANFGFDVCDVDGRVAVPDAVGRVRIFELDPAGRYRFAWGLSLFAPRRAAFSQDCSRLAVTSADDRSVYIIDTAARALVDVVRTGPALREVMATGPREISITDACAMTTYRW